MAKAIGATKHDATCTAKVPRISALSWMISIPTHGDVPIPHNGRPHCLETLPSTGYTNKHVPRNLVLIEVLYRINCLMGIARIPSENPHVGISRSIARVVWGLSSSTGRRLKQAAD